MAMIAHISVRQSEGTIRDVFSRKAQHTESANQLLRVLDELETIPDLDIWTAEGHGHLLLSRTDMEGAHIVSVIASEPELFTILAHAKNPLPFVDHIGDVRYHGLSLSNVRSIVSALFRERDWEIPPAPANSTYAG